MTPRPPTRLPSRRSAHSRLHSSSAQIFCSEKRLLVLGSGGLGTPQGSQRTSSQTNSTGAAAMLWSSRQSVTRTRRLGGRRRAAPGEGTGGGGERGTEKRRPGLG